MGKAKWDVSSETEKGKQDWYFNSEGWINEIHTSSTQNLPELPYDCKKNCDISKYTNGSFDKKEGN